MPVADVPAAMPSTSARSDAVVAQEAVSAKPNPALVMLENLEGPNAKKTAFCQRTHEAHAQASKKSTPKVAPKSKAASPKKSKNSKKNYKSKKQNVKKPKGNQKLPMQRFHGVSKSAQAQFPDGCSRCRWRAGCTKSCWIKRGYQC